MMLRRLCACAALSISLLLAGCTGMPEKVEPVQGFELNRYLGTWYEIARLDHSFESRLTDVTATYTLRDDGGGKVINRGYNPETGEWKEAEGKAYFVEEPDMGYLKVSFFGPFYGAYVIADLDKDGYQYSLVSGPDTSYLWILSRKPYLEVSTTQYLEEKAQFLGFDSESLIWVDQQQNMPKPVVEELKPVTESSGSAQIQ